ncbi:hypothetical protein BB561_006484 [Smittium simulii]|uniref:Uncharacterized protein n=1 Tax=Smittium simulii TaxID=133385 RepID=A0A2T9Y3W8_9FUNG|nr:hypothetical protein BB561_006484 [Smittium simulii]
MCSKRILTIGMLLEITTITTRLLGTVLGGELIISTGGMCQLKSRTPAVSNVLSIVHYMSAIFTPHAIILNRIMGAPSFWAITLMHRDSTGSQKNMFEFFIFNRLHRINT